MSALSTAPWFPPTVAGPPFDGPHTRPPGMEALTRTPAPIRADLPISMLPSENRSRHGSQRKKE
jgi:hypothetical protein